jgi:hypothetical protein
MNKYEDDVQVHRRLVKGYLDDMAMELAIRAANHDLSKFSPEEQEIYERVTPEFVDVKYGTPEYEAVKAKLGPALEHHYRYNDHHPEHFHGGISDMTLMQISEMVADWHAAIRRDPNAHLMESLEALRVKYGVEPQLFEIIKRTIIWFTNGSPLTPRRNERGRE